MAGNQGKAGRLKIVSGGQTGVDRAALDAALAADLPIGGWCPRGRRAEDGRIDDIYPLRETPLKRYSQRTRWNVRDSDATLILYRDEISGGTALTLECARALNRPFLSINLESPRPFPEWLEAHDVGILNCAGPRETEDPGIYRIARSFLERQFILASESHESNES